MKTATKKATSRNTACIQSPTSSWIDVRSIPMGAIAPGCLLPNVPTRFENEHVTRANKLPGQYAETELLLDEDYTVRRHDVICAPQGARDGCCSYSYPGNERFQYATEMRVERYQQAQTRLEKMKIVKEIVSAVRQAGGGFIRHVHEYCITNDGEEAWPGQWIDIGNVKARAKASHAMRKALKRNAPRSLSSPVSAASNADAATRAEEPSKKKPKLAFKKKMIPTARRVSIVSTGTTSSIEQEDVPKLLLMPILSPTSSWAAMNCQDYKSNINNSCIELICTEIPVVQQMMMRPSFVPVVSQTCSTSSGNMGGSSYGANANGALGPSATTASMVSFYQSPPPLPFSFFQPFDDDAADHYSNNALLLGSLICRLEQQDAESESNDLEPFPLLLNEESCDLVAARSNAAACMDCNDNDDGSAARRRRGPPSVAVEVV